MKEETKLKLKNWIVLCWATFDLLFHAVLVFAWIGTDDLFVASAAFYLFPDFEICRAKLLEKSCKTGQDMCDLLFEEEKVALMPGGSTFLRPEEELTSRLCYIDFNGGDAMKASEKIGLEKSLPEDFVEKEVKTMFDAIQKLCNFVKRYS
ncbi:Oidioi.mRNA.OKI2018_I69.chr2.g4305.t1.cds [Oikopleura dioica]|uniref:Oidioi.mRNA.OKI2018_I69.chr2.g4305.t1.cds n=1 Tax=Oikopleura dioica TaxID=34765 RepID=A0ABN7SWP0_OIKDI|nr:Oidioi.mRNA.OKI2018_I69.chr2.g4305.t1.cds [Oikopleura dioica]